MEETQESPLELRDNDAKISMHAIAGTRGPRTMRFSANIKNRRVVVLIDNRSSHNFVNAKLAERFNLLMTRVDVFRVKVVNGEGLNCDKMYKGVPIKIQGVTITANLYALPHFGPDVVLGVQWLENLGPVVSDYGKGSMEF